MSRNNWADIPYDIFEDKSKLYLSLYDRTRKFFERRKRPASVRDIKLALRLIRDNRDTKEAAFLADVLSDLETNGLVMADSRNVNRTKYSARG